MDQACPISRMPCHARTRFLHDIDQYVSNLKQTNQDDLENIN